MKKFWVFSLAALAVLGFILATSLNVKADSVPVLTITDGTNIVTVFDNGPNDKNPLVGWVTFLGAVGAWNGVTTGISPQLLKPIPNLDLNSVNQGPGTLQIAFTDIDFTPAGPFNMMIGGTTTGMVDYSLYLDESNLPFGQASLIGHLGPLGSGAFSGAISVNPLISKTPYSLTQYVAINHSQTGGLTSFDAAVNPVPEPSALLLLGTGLAGLGVWRFRRK